MKEHRYATRVNWTGNRGTGTSHYRAYGRDHEVIIEGKPVLLGSSDPTFRGDRDRHNPEDLLISALSQCHLLAYLHRCAVNGVVVTAYTDDATGTMITDADGRGAFREVTLHPRVTVTTSSDPELARRLHDDAHADCFIAASVNFPVHHRPEVTHPPTPVDISTP